jgi:phospholipid-transporting ATPase
LDWPAPAPLPGQRNLYFNLRAISAWLFTAVVHAVIILATVMMGAHSTEADREAGQSLAVGQDGILMFSIVIITVHAQLAVVIDHWTWMHHASCWGSVGVFRR